MTMRVLQPYAYAFSLNSIFYFFFLLFGLTHVSCDFNEKLHRNAPGGSCMVIYTHFNDIIIRWIFFSACVHLSTSKWVKLIKFYKIGFLLSLYQSSFARLRLTCAVVVSTLHTIMIYLTWGHFLLSFSSKPQENMSNGGSLFPIRNPSHCF